VLIVDDEPYVLKAFQRILRTQYDVVVAEGGAEGLAHLGPDEHFDVVICDLSMPEIDGPALYEAIVDRAPQLANHIIFCSGGPCTTRAQDFIDSQSRPLLEKPVQPDDLRAAVAAARVA
jgi:DNA-binding NtrC family response regulator